MNKIDVLVLFYNYSIKLMANVTKANIKCPKCENVFNLSNNPTNVNAELPPASPLEEIMKTLNSINSRIDDLYTLIKLPKRRTDTSYSHNPSHNPSHLPDLKNNIDGTVKMYRRRTPEITPHIKNTDLINWINNKYDIPRITFIEWTDIITDKINANHLTLIFNKGFVKGMIKIFQEIIPNDISYITSNNTNNPGNNSDCSENTPLPICAFTETKKIYGVLDGKWTIMDNATIVKFIYAIDTAVMKQFYIWKRSNTLTNSEGTMSNVYIKNLNKIMVSRSENMELLQNGLYLHICRKLPVNVYI